MDWEKQIELRNKLAGMKFDPLGDGISRLEYVDHMGDDYGIVQAARASRVSPEDMKWRGEEDIKLLKYMLKHGHGTPFEQNSIKLFVVAPMPIAVQWLRHRMASYNMLSRRYTNEHVQFYIPKVWRIQDNKENRQGSKTYNKDADGNLLGFSKQDQSTISFKYEDVLESADHYYTWINQTYNVANEQARFILPQATYTQFYVTANLRSWMNFYDLREDLHAQEEIRLYTKGLDDILSNIFNISWPLFKKQRKERKFLERTMEVSYDEIGERYFVVNKLTNESGYIKEEDYENNIR